MNKQELVTLVAGIQAAYNMKLTKEQLMVWFDNLNDLDYLTTQKAIKKIIQTSEYPPSIATIRKEYNEVMGVKKVNSVEVIGLLTKVTSKFGRYKQIEGMEWLKKQNEAAYEILKAMGYVNYCNCQPSVTNHLVEKMVKSIEGDANKTLLLARQFGAEIKTLQLETLKQNSDIEPYYE